MLDRLEVAIGPLALNFEQFLDPWYDFHTNIAPRCIDCMMETRHSYDKFSYPAQNGRIDLFRAEMDHCGRYLMHIASLPQYTYVDALVRQLQNTLDSLLECLDGWACEWYDCKDLRTDLTGRTIRCEVIDATIQISSGRSFAEDLEFQREINHWLNSC